MGVGAGEERRDLVEQKDKKEEVAELLKRLELGQVPDDEIKRLMKLQLDRRIRWGYKPTYEQQLAHVVHFAHSLRKMSIATAMDTLDSEMYEVPMSFFKFMFGSTFKASCCYFKDDSVTLDEAEIAMLDLYCERSQINDGQRVLDIGCGQGALSMHIARKYKNCRVTAITNSVSQKDYIEEQCKINNLTNLEVKLADITKHEIDDRYDRILAIAFIEHMKNYQLLLRKISKWMTPDGLLFIDHVCQKTFPYHYEPIDEDDWYTAYIFPAGSMIIPSANLLLYFQDDVTVVNHWTLNGKHFSRTHEMWLKNMDANAKAMKEIMLSVTGSEEAAVKQMNYWRGFNFSGIELFKYGNGEEWMTSHVLLKKK